MNDLTEYKKNGFKFVQVKREGDFALFVGTKPGSNFANWEVIEIQSHNGMTIGGKEIAPAEYAPGNNAWGAKGWTFLRSEPALEKLNQLSETAAALK